MDEKHLSHKISMIVMDVDGTLTDGHIYVTDGGEICKAFYVRDGYAIKHILPQEKIVPVVITGRKSAIVDTRTKELGIEYVYQGVSDKEKMLISLKENLDLKWDEIACIGDDINDLPMFRRCGASGCPRDAEPKVRKEATFICSNKGGKGAVREFIEWIINENRKIIDVK